MASRRDDLARRRAAIGHTQESLAAALSVDPSTVYRWEAGDSEPRPWLRPGLARALHVSMDQLTALIDGRSATTTGLTPAPPSGSSASPRPARSGAGAVALESFRATDSQVGGGHLYARLVEYLQEAVAPSLVGAAQPGIEPISFDAAASLTEMAGWMAHEAGLDTQAESHFSRASDLVRIGGDSQLQSHVLASRSHLALHQRKVDRSIALAREGVAILDRGPANHGLKAHLLGIEARAHAKLGDARAARQLVRQAGEAASRSPGGEQSNWVAPFDEASLASEVFRCMHDLHDLAEARRQAEQILKLRPPSRARSRTLGQIGLAKVAVAQRQLDEAIVNTEELLTLSHSVTSAIVTLELAQLAQMLEQHRGAAGIADLLEHLVLVVDQRRWLDSRHTDATAPLGPGDPSER